jgi:hypothetical protein
MPIADLQIALSDAALTAMVVANTSDDCRFEISRREKKIAGED